MFTFIRNFRTLFMLTLTHNLEWAVNAFDTTDDDTLDATETQALLESPEAKNIVGLAEVDTLEAAVDVSKNIDFSDTLNTFEQQTIQYLATKILKLNRLPIQDGSIDGNIGRGSRADIAAASDMIISSNADINQSVLDALTTKAGDLITAKRAEFALAQQEAKDAERLQKQSHLKIITDFDMENDRNDVEKVKALQTALQALNISGYPVNIIDGVITPGKSTEKAYNFVMANMAQEEDTSETKGDKEEESNIDELSVQEHALAALEAIKKDRNAVKAIQEAVWVWVDGISWPKTRAAVEANAQKALEAIALYIDTTDNASVAKRLVSEKPNAGTEIDSALSEWINSEPSSTKMQEIVKKFTWDVDSHTRNANAQYIALWLQENTQEWDLRAGQIMEAIMAEGAGHYEQETTELQLRQALVDGSGRFARHLASFPENFSGSYYRVGQTLQSRSGRGRVENGMESGLTGTASEITQALFGVDGNYLATRVHILTGQWKDGSVDTSVEIADGIILSNAYYDEKSGAIYAVVAKWNGCEWNLVVIPVETFIKPKPKPVVKRKPTPIAVPPVYVDLPETEVPEKSDGRIIKNRWCNPNTNTIWIQYGYEWIPWGESVDTGEPCDGGRDGWDRPNDPGGRDHENWLWSTPTETWQQAADQAEQNDNAADQAAAEADAEAEAADAAESQAEAEAADAAWTDDAAAETATESDTDGKDQSTGWASGWFNPGG